MSSFRTALFIEASQWLLLLLVICAAVLLPAVAAQAKTHTNLLTAAEVAEIRRTRQWEGINVSSVLATANNWMKYTPEELRQMVPPAWIPRAYDVNFKQDPQHSTEILRMGRYPFIVNPDLPYKITCPVGGEIYPTNDFDPTQITLPNQTTSDPYVDYGWGWSMPGDQYRYWFVGYYVHWLWQNHLRPAVLALGQAYIITGDRKYARQAAVLLDRIAEEYPQMDYQSQSREGFEIYVGNYPGRILNNIWETAMVTDLAVGYDYAYEGMEGDTLLEEAVQKSVAEIRRHIEQNLLENAARSIYTMDMRIRGNFGMHQKALATIAFVLDNENTGRYIDFVLHNTGGRHWLDEGVLSGLTNFLFRDGAPNESSPGYNSLWLNQLNEVAGLLKDIGIDLYKSEPKLKRLYDYPLRIVMADKFSPNIGDTGSVKSEGIVGWNNYVYGRGFKEYGDRSYLLGKPLSTKSDNMSAYGLAMLRSSGQGGPPAGISIYYGPGGGHDHFARLNLEMFAKGSRILPDLGYPEYANAYSKKDQVWVRNTVSHNVMVVDEKRQATKDGGRLQAFAALPDVQYVDVRAEEAYPGIERYQRSVALINAPEGEVYALDVFRVAGGQQHDYSLHGPEGRFTVSGIELSPVQPGTAAGPDVPYGYLYDAPAMEVAGFRGPYSSYTGSGYSYLTNVQHGTASSVWSADWQLAGARAHLRATFIPQSETGIIVADGEPPRNVVGNPEWLKYILARQKAAGPDSFTSSASRSTSHSSPSASQLASTFVTILEPYEEQPFITGVRPLGGRLPAGADQVVALAVEHRGGTDYLFQAIAAAAGGSWPEESAAFRGSLGVISYDQGGMIRHASLVGDGYLKHGPVSLESAGAYRGAIAEVDYSTGRIVVELDESSLSLPEGEVLAGSRIVIANDQHATEYEIKEVRQLGGRRYEMHFTDTYFQTGKGLAGTVIEYPGRESRITSPTPMVLNTYYNGQWLVNPNNGRGGRISSFTGNGRSITVASGELGLTNGDYFYVYDFGAGDRFQITVTISLKAASAGRYEVQSNVPGRLELWNGAGYDLSPGTQMVAVPVLEPTLPNWPTAPVSGLFRPEFGIIVPAGLEWQKVEILLDDVVIYTGPELPVQGILAIDTTSLTDGEHRLQLRATDSFGIAVGKTGTFEVKNWWEIDTQLQAPVVSAWFGAMDFTSIYEKSAGWSFVKDRPQEYLGDIDRMIRVAPGDQYIIWETPNLRSFEITFYSKEVSLPAEVELAISPDGKQWEEVPAQVQVTGSSESGRQRLVVAGELPETAAGQFFRILVRSALPLDGIELGAVKLRGRVR